MQATAKPLVSVCIPVYNRKEMLRSCLWSIVRQTLKDIEVIVTDNCSEDDLSVVVREFNDSRILYHRNSRNLGPCINFIRAAVLSKGKYLKFLCSDDLLLPNCLEESVKELESYPNAIGLLFKCASFDESGCVDMGISPLPWKGIAHNLNFSEHKKVFDYYRIGPTAVLYRSNTFWELGGIDLSVKNNGDWEIYSRMLQSDRGLVFFDRVLAISRIHDGNDSILQASNLGFLNDILNLRRQGRLPKWSIAYSDNIWRQLSQDLREGRSVLPVFKMLFKYGYFGNFLLMLPMLTVKHLMDRVKRNIGTENLSGLSAEADPELERLLNETWTMSRGCGLAE